MGLTTNPCLGPVLTPQSLQSPYSRPPNIAKVICLLAWAGLAAAAPQRTIVLGGRDSLNTGSVVDTILAQLDTPINNAIQAALSGIYSSKTVSSSPVETSFTSVVSQAPAITVQTSGTFSTNEGEAASIEGQYNGFSTSEGDSSSFTTKTDSDDSSFFSSSSSTSQDANSFFSSIQSTKESDSYLPLTTFTSTSDSGSGFNSGSSSSSSSSSSESSSIVSQVVGELGPQIDEAVRAALAALKTTTTTTTVAVEPPAPEPAPTPVTTVTTVSSVV